MDYIVPTKVEENVFTNWNKFKFPIIRRIYAKTISSQIIGITPEDIDNIEKSKMNIIKEVKENMDKLIEELYNE